MRSRTGDLERITRVSVEATRVRDEETMGASWCSQSVVSLEFHRRWQRPGPMVELCWGPTVSTEARQVPRWPCHGDRVGWILGSAVWCSPILLPPRRCGGKGSCRHRYNEAEAWGLASPTLDRLCRSSARNINDHTAHSRDR